MDSAIDALRVVVEACEAASADYAVIGGVARNAWAPPRATTDLDLAIFVTAPIYASLLRELAASGFQPDQTVTTAPEDALPDVVLLRRGSGTVRRLDLLLAKSDFEKEAVAHAVIVDIGIPCRVVRPEHLIVYKLIAGRPRDLGDAEDVARIQELAGNHLDLALVRKWSREWEVEERLERLLACLSR